MAAKISVLVVDDSALVRRLLAELIDRQGDMRCVGAAGDALAAREMIRALNPDVLTLDVEMPQMDGIEFLGRLMRLRPMPVVMVSTLTERGADVTLRALELGAVDFVAKPRIGVDDGLRRLADELAAKIRAAAAARVRRLRPAAPAGAPGPAAAAAAAPTPWRPNAPIVFVGASTGGTEATRELLVRWPADAPALMVAQHMPPGFTQRYAQRLDGLCHIRVKEAADGEPVRPGHAYIAPGGQHLWVQRSGAGPVARVGGGDPVNLHKPSVDVLFRSAARELGPRALGVMLSGMGADGAQAMKAMRDAGSWNVCQDEASCVVFGMPRMAIAEGAAHAVLPPSRIAQALLERLHGQALPATERA